MPELSIAIPFYNEEKNVKQVTEDIVNICRQENIDYELILINNGSKDNTNTLIDELVKKNKRLKKVMIETNQGYGYGINKGLQQCTGTYIGWTDGDGQVDAKSITGMFKRIKQSKKDVIKATRKKREDGVQRKISSLVYNTITRILFHVNTKDINGKPKIMKQEVYHHVDLTSKDFFIDTELIVKAQALGYTREEYPITFIKRKEGKSNVKLKTTYEFLKNVMKLKRSLPQFLANHRLKK